MLFQPMSVVYHSSKHLAHLLKLDVLRDQARAPMSSHHVLCHGNSSIHKAKKPPLTKLLDAHRESSVYNQNQYAGFDKDNLYIGEYTPLDKMFHEQETSAEKSTNPMDVNWGGVAYTEKVIDSGAYSGDEVQLSGA